MQFAGGLPLDRALACWQSTRSESGRPPRYRGRKVAPARPGAVRGIPARPAAPDADQAVVVALRLPHGRQHRPRQNRMPSLTIAADCGVDSIGAVVGRVEDRCHAAPGAGVGRSHVRRLKGFGLYRLTVSVCRDRLRPERDQFKRGPESSARGNRPRGEREAALAELRERARRRRSVCGCIVCLKPQKGVATGTCGSS
jgi:hypothetical protein